MPDHSKQACTGRLRLRILESGTLPLPTELKKQSVSEHASATLLLPMDGGITVAVRQRNLNISAGEAVFIPAQYSLHIIAIEGRAYWAEIMQSALPAAAFKENSLGLKYSQEYAAMLTSYLSVLLHSDRREEGFDSTGLDLGFTELARLGLYGMSHEWPHEDSFQSASKPENLTLIQEWIRGRLYDSNLSTGMIQEHFFISRSSLYELFKSSGGVDSYIQAQRLGVAMAILESPCETTLNISQLAIRLGFRSASSFSRAFKQRWGLSPKMVKDRAG